jgi:iron uptake system component EfeO
MVPLVARVALVALVGAACSSGGGQSASTTRPTDQPVAPPIPVTLTDAGCVPADFSLHPGTVTFRVTNPGSKKVTEMEVQDANGHVRGDVEGVTPGHTRSFLVDLKIGTYRVRCPQDAPTGGTITVT